MACIHDQASKLNQSDELELLQLYAANLDKGLSGKQATQEALKSMAIQNLAERDELSFSASELGATIPRRKLTFNTSPPKVNKSRKESKEPILNKENVEAITNRIRNIPSEKLPTDKLKALRTKLLKTLEVISEKEPSKISDSFINNTNTGLVQLADGIKAFTPSDTSVKTLESAKQVGNHTQTETTGNLSTDILRDGLSYNTPLKNDSSVNNDGTRDTLATNIQVKENNDSKTVLTDNNNFFSNLNTEEVQSNLPVLNENQTKSLNILKTFTETFNKILTENSIKYFTQSKIFKNNLEGNDKDKGDPFGYLLQVDNDGNRYINENLATAMSVVAYNWIATQGKKTLHNNKSAINSILGKSDESVILQLAKETLTYIGTPRNAIAESLGIQAFNLLGLEGKPGIDGKYEDRLKLAIGEAIITTLLNNNNLEQTSIPTSVMSELADGGTLVINPNSATNFIRIQGEHNISTGENIPSDTNKDIIENIKTSDSVIEELFDISSFETGPHTTKVKTLPKFLKGTNKLMKVPTLLKNSVKILQDVSWVVKGNIFNLVQFLGKDTILKIEGYLTEEEINEHHVTERLSLIAKNESIVRALDNAVNFVNESSEVSAPFYFEYEVWRNSRVGIVSNTVNPSATPMHRHLFGIKSHRVKVNTVAQRNAFKLAVSLAFGHSIDKTTEKTSLDRFDQIINNDIVKKGIKALSTKQTSENKLELQQDILAAIEYGGGGIHTLDGLVALGAYSPSKTFNTNLGIETDGITNGVIIGLLQSMLESDMNSVLAAGGIFTSIKDTNFGTWKEQSPTNFDSYERLANIWNKELVGLNLKENSGLATVTFLKSIFSPLAELNENKELVITEGGRKISKTPLMTTNYGAGIKRIIQLLEETAVQNFYNKIVEISKNPNAEIVLDKFISDFNFATGAGISDPNLETILEYKLPFQIEQDLKDLVNATYGKALQESLDKQFEGFSRFRDTINSAFKTMFYAFDARYQKELKQKEKDKGASLTQDEKNDLIKELINLVPSIKTALSEGIDDSIIVMKQDKVRTYDNDRNSIQQKTATPTKNTKAVTGKTKGQPTNSVTGTISETVLADGGVAGLILAIQSMDSAIISKVYESFNILNIYDAGYYSLNDVVDGTKKYNEIFLELNEQYSILEEVETSLQRILSESFKDKVLYKEISIKIQDDTFLGDAVSPRDVFNDVKKLSEEVKAKRKEVLTRIKYSSQASYPNAEYSVKSVPETSTSLDQQIKVEIDRIADEISKPKQSSAEEINFDNFNASYQSNLTGQNSLNIFDAIVNEGNVQETVEHQATLKELLESLVNKVISPLDGAPLNIDVALNQVGDAVYGAVRGTDSNNRADLRNSEIKIKAGNGVIGDGNQISAQETLVHELIHVISSYGINSRFPQRLQLLKLFERAKKELKIEDFLPVNSNGTVIIHTDVKAEYTAAKARYDYIFNNTNSLHEFMAFGLTNKAFAAKLAKISATPKRDLKSGTLLDRLGELYNLILDWVSGKIYGTKGENIDVALRILTEEIVGINDKNKVNLFKALDLIHEVNPFIFEKLDKLLFDPLTKYYASIKNKSNKGVIGNVVSASTGAFILSKNKLTGEAFANITAQIAKAINLTESNFLVKLTREITGVTTNNFAWHDLLRFSKKYIDQARKHLADNVISDLRDRFSRELTKDESIAINKILLKTDLISLVNRYNTQTIKDIISKSSALNTAIENTIKELDSYSDVNQYYIKQADSLGHIMATGNALEENTMLNANNIANVITEKNIIPDGDIKVAEEIIDRLATLYAIKYSSKTHKNTFSKLLDTELDGIAYTLDVHKGFKKDSLEQLFNGNKILLIKGYTQEIFNPGIDYKIGKRSDEETMKIAGYYPHENKLESLPKDRDDPNKDDAIMYVSKTNAPNTYVKTTASLTNLRAKGTTLLDSYQDAGIVMARTESIIALNEVKRKKSLAVQRQFKKGGKNHNNDNILIPIINEKGEITDYRYLMTEHVKETLLEKDNRFDIILGRMSGGIKDKVNSRIVNNNILKLAFNDYKNDFSKNPSKFVRISSTSADKRYQDIWAMMPNTMKKDMKRIWGNKELIVKEELIDLIFGYRKLTLNDTFLINKFNNSSVGQLMRSKMYFGLAENVWQEVVAIAKDNIVIKSFVVLKDNIISNNFLLWVKGVPIQDIFKNQAIALLALNAYQKELNKVDKLKRELSISSNITKSRKLDISNKITRLEDNLNNNPVKELIDEGIFQSIIEDININENDFSFKRKLTDKFKDKTEKFIANSNVRTTATEVYKQAYLTRDTFTYRQLLKATQYSDFVARFTLYQHLTKKKNVSKDKAIVEIIETFVNYDVPTSPQLQYLNDIGVIMFTKFLFRIQRIILRLLKENPSNALALYSLQGAIGNVADITDSNLLTTSLISRINNTLFNVPDNAAYMAGFEHVSNLIPTFD